MFLLYLFYLHPRNSTYAESTGNKHEKSEINWLNIPEFIK